MFHEVGEKMHESRLANHSIIFIALVLLAIVLKNFQSVLRPLAIATLLVFMVAPLARYSKKKRMPVWLTFSGLLVIFVLLLSLISSYVTEENLDLASAIPRYQERIRQNTGGVLAFGSKLGFGLEGMTPETLGKLAAKGAKKGLQAARTIFSEALLSMILMMFIIQAYSGLFAWVEKKYGGAEVKKLHGTFEKIEGDILAYFGTKTTMSLGTAIGTGAVLFLFKAKFIYISLLIVFVLNFIPVIGSLIAVGIILVLYLLTLGASASAAWLFMALMAVQVFFGSILEPKIAGSRLKMSPILIILSLYVWGWIWGIIGMLLSVPLTIFIMIVVKHVGQMKRKDPQEATVT
jgi:AI-2 transport protein TqsA